MKIKFNNEIDVWYGVVEHYKERYGDDWNKVLQEHGKQLLIDIFSGEGLCKKEDEISQ